MSLSAGEAVGVADGLGVEVDAGDAAGGALGDIDGVAAGAAAEFEDVGVLSDFELGWDVLDSSGETQLVRPRSLP